MKKRHMILACALAALVLSASIGGAWSYFTTYAEAKGGYTISLGDETRVHEDFSGWEKRVSVSNEESSNPVYIRVKVFAGNEYQKLLQYSGDGWNAGADGYYYYSEAVDGGAATGDLLISLKDIKDQIPEKDGERFNVVVIYESTPVAYDTNGDPVGWDKADWTQTVDTGNAGGEAE